MADCTARFWCERVRHAPEAHANVRMARQDNHRNAYALAWSQNSPSSQSLKAFGFTGWIGSRRQGSPKRSQEQLA